MEQTINNPPRIEVVDALRGFTFYIQHTNQKKRGKDFGYRFLWRLVLLAGFATLNAAFFPAGDILLSRICLVLNL